MNINPLQMPKSNDLKLALSHCRLRFADFCVHLILDMDLNVKPNLELNLKQKSNKNCLATRS